MNTQYFDARDAKRFVQLLDLARNDGNPHIVKLHDDGSVTVADGREVAYLGNTPAGWHMDTGGELHQRIRIVFNTLLKTKCFNMLVGLTAWDAEKIASVFPMLGLHSVKVYEIDNGVMFEHGRDTYTIVAKTVGYTLRSSYTSDDVHQDAAWFAIFNAAVGMARMNFVADRREVDNV